MGGEKNKSPVGPRKQNGNKIVATRDLVSAEETIRHIIRLEHGRQVRRANRTEELLNPSGCRPRINGSGGDRLGMIFGRPKITKQIHCQYSLSEGGDLPPS
jgi:hypothetical protein